MTHFDYPNNQSDSNIIPNLKRVCKILIPPESRNLKIGGTVWTKSEPFLSKIQRILRIESRPAFPPASASLRRAKQKNLLYIFLIARPQNFFQLRKRKFFCFDIPLLAEWRKRSHPNRAFGAESASGQKFLPPNPLPFCPLASTPARRARRRL